jgi:hypothetical protein
MPLSKEQAHGLHDALMSAFPSRSNLKQMVRFRLDENLDEIAAEGSLSVLTFDLIRWAEAGGRTDELVKGALEEQPLNPELQGIATEMGVPLPPLPPPPRSTPPPPSRWERLLSELRRRRSWIIVGLLLIVAALVFVVISTMGGIDWPNDLFTNQQPMTVDELKQAGAYVRIESIDPSPEKKVFTEGEREKVVVVVSYDLPGQSVTPTLEFEYLDKTEPRHHSMVMQRLPAVPGKHRVQMVGEVIGPSLSDLHGTPFQIEVDLSVLDEVTGRTFTVASDHTVFELKTK